MHPVRKQVVCGRKRGYPTQSKANKALFTMHYDDVAMRVYECPVCFMWHLGHVKAKRITKQED